MSWFIKYSKYTQERDTTLTRFKVAQDKGMIKQGLKGQWSLIFQVRAIVRDFYMKTFVMKQHDLC